MYVGEDDLNAMYCALSVTNDFLNNLQYDSYGEAYQLLIYLTTDQPATSLEFNSQEAHLTQYGTCCFALIIRGTRKENYKHGRTNIEQAWKKKYKNMI